MSNSGDSPRLSIIIPVLNEAETLPSLIDALRPWRRVAEILLVDGGSDDGTAGLAVDHVDRVLVSAPGRARQQNTGAAEARGDYLLFLHCDTRLGIAPDALAEALRGHPAWGFFPVRLSGGDWRFRIIERFMSWRSRLSHVATGDQCLFVDRTLFQSLGGFTELPLMEDVDLSKRLRRQSDPTVLRPPVVTSSRRWEQRGVLRTVLLMWELRFRYWLGADAEALALKYRGH